MPYIKHQTKFNSQANVLHVYTFTALTCLLFLLTPTSVLAQAKESSKPGESIRVLFVGNSYTAANNLPLMFTRLSEAGKQAKVTTSTSLRGGWTLSKHWAEETPATKKTITDKKFHYIIFQEQSQMPFMYPKVTHEFGVKLGNLAKSKGATPVFYMTWARLHQPENQSKITTAYRQLGRTVNAPVAPVCLAWESFLKENTTVKLHRSDKSHPTPAGTYLAACVFYGTIHKQSPVGLPSKLFVQPNGKGKAIVQLIPSQAKSLQQAAWKAVQQEKK